MSAPTAHFDLIIIGGSFAGLACARTAALRGLKVAVVDTKPEPGTRVRTTGIVVKEAADDTDLPCPLMRKVRGVRLYAPDNRSLDLHAPGYYFQATDTARLLRWLATEAERAGTHLMFGRKFDGGTSDGRTVSLPSLGLDCDFLIGADGAKSRVAQAFGLDRNRRFLIGLEAECEPIPQIDPRFLHCIADSAIAPGYIAWIVPGPCHTQIGVAASHGRKPDLNGLMERARLMWGLNSITVVERRSGLIPSGGPVRTFANERVLLIGDAAGVVSPVTGGGIHTALHFGRRAAQCVSDYLCDRGGHPAAVLAREIPRYRSKLLARRVLDLGIPNALLNAALLTAPMRALAQRIYFHKRGSDAQSFEEWSGASNSGAAGRQKNSFEHGDVT